MGRRILDDWKETDRFPSKISGRYNALVMRRGKGSTTKYYVVTHGKCPGIYDDWEKLQAQIKDFKGAEYTSKNSKKEAIELFHEKRPDWPKHRIPDFTIHASNRLQPLETSGKKSGGGGGFFGSLFGRNRRKEEEEASPTDSVDSEISLHNGGGGKKGSTSSTPRVSDLEGNYSDSSDHQLGLPREQVRPEKIVLQQNWLDDPVAEHRAASRQSSNPTPIPHTKRPPLSPAVHKIRSVSLTDTSTALLLPPKLEEFEFSKRDLLLPEDRADIGVNSPVPFSHRQQQHQQRGDRRRDRRHRGRSGSEGDLLPSIELFPSPSSALAGDINGERRNRRHRRDRRDREDRRKNRDRQEEEEERRRSRRHEQRRDEGVEEEEYYSKYNLEEEEEENRRDERDSGRRGRGRREERRRRDRDRERERRREEERGGGGGGSRR